MGKINLISFYPYLYLYFYFKSDWHLISPYHITPELNIKVRRIKELITNIRSSQLLDKFSVSEMFREQ